MEAISPVVRGLINGFSLGNMVQQHQMQKQQLAMHERQQQFDQETKSAGLLAQLAELGARPMTESDQLEVDGGLHANFNDNLPIEGGPSITSTPTDLPARILSMPGSGQQFVLPSAGERDQRAQHYTQRTLLDRNRAAAEAHAKLLEQNAGAAANTLEATGIMLPPSLLKRFGMKPGTKVDPSKMDDLMRADAIVSRGEKPAPPKKQMGTPSRFTGPGGQLMERVHYGDGTFEDRAINGTPVVRPTSGKPRTPAAGPKPTFAQTVDALTNQVLEDSAKGGGTTIDDAIKNVDAYYKDNPAFTGNVRQLIKSRLRKAADKAGPKNPTADKLQPNAATSAPANPYR